MSTTTDAGKAEGQQGAGGVGNTPPAPDAGKAPGTTTNGSASNLIPDNLMPAVEDLFNKRLEKKQGELRTQWEQEQADKKKREEMSEADRLKADNAAAQSRISALEAQATTNARVAEIVARSGGKVSVAIAEKVVAGFQGDWKPETALESALGEARSLLQAWGFDPDAKGPPPNIPGAGGSPAGTDGSGLTDAQIDEAVRTGQMKLEDANRIWDARRRAIRGR